MSQQTPAPTAARGRSAWMVAGLLTAATLAGFALEAHVSLASQAMLFILAVVVAAYRLPRVASVTCAFAGATLLNFFFIPPRFTFEVESSEHLVALFTMLTVALVISHLGTGLRREAAMALLHARRAGELQSLASELADARQPSQVLALAQRFLQHAFPGPASVALVAADGALAVPPECAAEVGDGMRACLREAATLGPGTGRWPGLNAWYLPLRAHRHAGGAVCVRNVSGSDHAGREHAEALCALLGQALSRLQLAATVRAGEEHAHWQRTQNTFLAAISHDFRTPLAAVLGAASLLHTQGDKLPRAEQQRLAGSIVREADHLSRLTENTLQLARLESRDALHLDWQSIEEIVGAVLARVRQRDATRRIRSIVPAGLPLVRADPVLLAQLLENLVDNALKYSTAGIDLEASCVASRLRIAVLDRGPGLPAGAPPGPGLGLALCQAIALAHDGSLTLQPREGGGTSCVLELPVAAEQPMAPAA